MYCVWLLEFQAAITPHFDCPLVPSLRVVSVGNCWRMIWGGEEEGEGEGRGGEGRGGEGRGGEGRGMGGVRKDGGREK